MFKGSISGMDKIFQTEPPAGSVVLIVGGPGTLKSAFTYNLISNSLNGGKDRHAQGIYITLEETRDSLLSNMRSLGIPPTNRLHIADVASFMRDIEHWADHLTDEKDYLELLLEKASRPLNIYPRRSDHRNGATSEGNNEAVQAEVSDPREDPLTKRPIVFALDSLNALNTIVHKDRRNIRREMNWFMFKLREKGVTSFIVMEVGDAKEHRPEHFLVDGIIELGMVSNDRNRFKRFMRVHKMRSTKHSIEPFLLEISDEGIAVVEELI